MTEHPVQRLVREHKAGRPVGIYSVCSAHPLVLEAAFRQAREDGSLVLIEATCNQVNQFGGYTRLRPAEFASRVGAQGDSLGFPRDRLILGGDHLGPSPWQNEPADSALAKAETLVKEYARAGFTKIHLDASMSCADDPVPLPDEIVARRAARLAEVCESAREPTAGSRPVYVVGTEVPTPGGAQGPDEGVRVTPSHEAAETLANARQAFDSQGVGRVWERVVAVVVQPGVEFGSESVIDYDRPAAQALSRFIETDPEVVYEAHSTDYQRPEALRALVEDHFCILKVGPWLTFALREGIFALASIEQELLGGNRPVQLSAIREVVENVMVREPAYWEKHYHGSAVELRFQRAYSLSDRIRYYWPQPEISEAIERLFANLTKHRIPDALITQFLPGQFWACRSGEVSRRPRELVIHRIREVLRVYSQACGMAGAEE